jgi:hypothetical protein
MDWQPTLVWITIGLAAVYLAWRAYRIVRPGKPGCGGGCGCVKAVGEKPPVLIAPDKLVLRSKIGRDTRE